MESRSPFAARHPRAVILLGGALALFICAGSAAGQNLAGEVLSLPATLLQAPSAGGTRYGFIELPRDEHEHLDGWNFWWGAADLVTESGNRYTVGVAFDSLYGVGLTGQEIFPRQGPYAGRSIMGQDGPGEWGHQGEPPGLFVRDFSVFVPGVTDLLKLRTLDLAAGLKNISSWERTSLATESYRLRLDYDTAKVHPTGESVKAVVELDADMQGPPLLAGGTGRWWYGVPETFGYRSRSYQYMQAAKALTGTLDLQQPDGSILHETVVPAESTLVMIREYDATPEDLFTGVALDEATQLHQRYAQYYDGGMPWELIFLDLRNGAQLMLAVIAYHDTPNGTLTPLVGPAQPTYTVFATLRLPSGESVALGDAIHVEHLSYKTIIGRVPTFWVAVKGIWKQAWDYRVSYPGGDVATPEAALVHVPPFDLGVVPEFAKSEPAVDDRGNGPTQRIPFFADGSYDGCPVHGFGWSELIINWYGFEDRDPWFTGGELPPVPESCVVGGPTPPSGTPGDSTPPPFPSPPPHLTAEGCLAMNPGAPSCSYEATVDGGVGGYGNEPRGWVVTITRASEPQPLVIKSFSGQEMYACGTIRPGDHVEATAPGMFSGVMAGNPGICF
jgi:hypothetical protein